MPRWADFAERTSNRGPMEFFEHAIATIDGDRGDGRLVVDVGCGAGVETKAFLERGWRVLAIDSEPRAIEILRASVSERNLARLETAVADFTEVELPKADVVYAQLSLPFAVQRFEAAVDWALDAVSPGGWFIGQFLGRNDSWAEEDWATVVTWEELERHLIAFDPRDVIEEEFDGDSSIGPKHWHWFRVEAQRA